MKRLSAAGGKIMGRRKQDDPDYVDPKKMIALEEEMAAL